MHVATHTPSTPSAPLCPKGFLRWAQMDLEMDVPQPLGKAAPRATCRKAAHSARPAGRRRYSSSFETAPFWPNLEIQSEFHYSINHQCEFTGTEGGALAVPRLLTVGTCEWNSLGLAVPRSKKRS